MTCWWLTGWFLLTLQLLAQQLPLSHQQGICPACKSRHTCTQLERRVSTHIATASSHACIDNLQWNIYERKPIDMRQTVRDADCLCRHEFHASLLTPAWRTVASQHPVQTLQMARACRGYAPVQICPLLCDICLGLYQLLQLIHQGPTVYLSTLSLQDSPHSTSCHTIAGERLHIYP